MRIFTRSIILVLGLILASPTAWSQAADTPQNRTAAAKRYAKTFDFNEMMGQSFQAIAQSLPAELRDDFVREANAMVNFQEMETFMMTAMVALFTTDELDKLADFYGTDQGQSILKKMPQLMTVLMPYMQQQAIKSIQRYVKEQQQRKSQPNKS